MIQISFYKLSLTNRLFTKVLFLEDYSDMEKLERCIRYLAKDNEGELSEC